MTQYHIRSLQPHAGLPAVLRGTPPTLRVGRGEGFCVFNDIAVSAGMAMAEYGIERVLVVDLDVHQGNGTAAIFENDPRVVTFDMHGGRPGHVFLHLYSRFESCHGSFAPGDLDSDFLGGSTGQP